MVNISINISPKIEDIRKQEAQKICCKVLKLVGIYEGEISLFFTNDREITVLNRKYRNVNLPTDVLAFSMREGINSEINPEILGDIVISVDMVRRNSMRFGTDFSKELYLYLIHGILHLLGFSDKDKKNRTRMEKKQQELLRKLVFTKKCGSCDYIGSEDRGQRTEDRKSDV